MKRLLLAFAATLLPCALSAQTAPAPQARSGTEAVQEADSPRAAVLGYFSAFREGDWSRATSFVHPRTLRAFRSVVNEQVSADSTGLILPILLGVESLIELDAMSDAEVFTRFYSRQLGNPEARKALASMEFEVTNVTMESDDAARVDVVMREGSEAPQPKTFPVLRMDGRWLLLLDEEDTDRDP
jgi:hypothetical protein